METQERAEQQTQDAEDDEGGESMKDYTKLVAALRCKDNNAGHCWETKCKYLQTSSYAWCDTKKRLTDAADAIEALQAELKEVRDNRREIKRACGLVVDEPMQMPKRGEWELIDGVEPMRWGCSRCKYMSWETSNYCPRCGAKMEVQE